MIYNSFLEFGPDWETNYQMDSIKNQSVLCKVTHFIKFFEYFTDLFQSVLNGEIYILYNGTRIEQSTKLNLEEN